MPKPLLRNLIIFVVLGSITLITSTLAQPPIPPPSSSIRASTELLTNGDFELDADNNKIPDEWTGSNTTIASTDKRKCDQPGSPVAHGGSCAFMFRGNSSGLTSKIQQTVGDTSAIVDGTEVMFGVYLDARSGVAGSKIGVAKISYSNGTSTKFTLTIPAARGVADYQLISDTQTISLPNGVTITKAKVDFRYNAKTGKFLIDDARFAIVTADPTTATATETTTATATETLSPTPTATATSTPILPSTHLIANDGATNDQFGISVDIDGDTAIVGAYSVNNHQGAVYIFTRSGAVWSQQQKLTASDGAADDAFGNSVAIDGDTVVVGAPEDDIGANTDQGSAYVFMRSGTVWTEQQHLTASDGVTNDIFGYSVAINGDTIVVGAPVYNFGETTNQGLAYVFTRSGTVWTEQQKLTASDGAAHNVFGNSVDIEGDTVVVGAQWDDVGANTYQGSAYVFTRSGTVWSEQQQLIANDGAADDFFGFSVAISGDTVVVGAAGDDVGVSKEKGSAYVFTRSGIVWIQQAQLTANNGTSFGYAAAISGDTVVVGAAYNDIGANTNQGSAYIFTRSGTVWSQHQPLITSDGAADDSFGISVAISGYAIVIGAFGDDIGANADQGSAYVFEIVP